MNLPGILSINYFKASEASLPFLQNGDIVDISEITSETLTPLLFIPDSCSMNVVEKHIEHGSVYNITIPFKIAGNEKDDFTLLTYLSSIAHIYVVTDKNDNNYLIGSKDNAQAFVSFKSKNDADAKGGRSISGEMTLSTNVFPLFAQ